MASTIDDSMPARIPKDCPDDVRDVLYTAWSHDLSDLKKILKTRDDASKAQDPTTGETPLHAAIRACGPREPSNKKGDENVASGDEDDEDDGPVGEAKETMEALFNAGAIWNDVDSNNETPGCVALRLGRKGLYRLCVYAGCRAERLLAVLDEYEELPSEDEDAGDDDAEEKPAANDQDEEMADVEKHASEQVEAASANARFVPPDADEKNIMSQDYLQSDLTYDADKLLDADLNGVMMAWETDIMEKSVQALLPEQATGKRILNIGFGMGIIDGMFAARNPAKHHIIEAHPAVLEHIAKPESKFGAKWEESGPEPGAFKVHKGRWQDVVPQLMNEGEVYDAIYFDTFGEDYSELRRFFTDMIPGILDFEGRFSFFNGLGADRQVCYDVYRHVLEVHTEEAGLDIEWAVHDVDMGQLDAAGKGDWEGVRRRYWTLKKYWLPTLTNMG